MRRSLLLPLLCLVCVVPSPAHAQAPADPATDGSGPSGDVSVEDAASPAPPSADESAATPVRADEPTSAAAADGGDEEPSTATSAERPSGRLGDPRGHTRVEATAEATPVAAHAELSAQDVPAPPLAASAEVSIGMAPALGYGLSGAGALGALGGLGAGGLGLAGRTDFVFSVDPRIFLGLGLAVSHSEQFGAAPSTFNQVDVPLIAQVYFDTPRRGAAVPTLRVSPALRWDAQEGVGSPGPREALGGRLTLGIGATWFATDWLAVRLLGDVGASASVVYRGAEGNSISVFVGADLGVVVRL